MVQLKQAEAKKKRRWSSVFLHRYSGWRKGLSRYNLENKWGLGKLGRFVNGRTAVSFGLLGIGVGLGAGSAIGIGAFALRRAFAGVGTGIGSYDLMSHAARGLERRKIESALAGGKTILRLENVEEYLARLESRAVLDGQSLRDLNGDALYLALKGKREEILRSVAPSELHLETSPANLPPEIQASVDEVMKAQAEALEPSEMAPAPSPAEAEELASRAPQPELEKIAIPNAPQTLEQMRLQDEFERLKAEIKGLEEELPPRSVFPEEPLGAAPIDLNKFANLGDGLKTILQEKSETFLHDILKIAPSDLKAIENMSLSNFREAYNDAYEHDNLEFLGEYGGLAKFLDHDIEVTHVDEGFLKTTNIRKYILAAAEAYKHVGRL